MLREAETGVLDYWALYLAYLVNPRSCLKNLGGKAPQEHIQGCPDSHEHGHLGTGECNCMPVHTHKKSKVHSKVQTATFTLKKLAGLKRLYGLVTYMFVCAQFVHMVPMEARRGFQIAFMGCWDLNLGLLEE